MTYKLVVSKPTKDVLTETDPNNLIFSSEYNTLKYYVSGSVLVNVPTESSPQTYEEVIVSHDLGYYPFFVAYIEFPDASPGQYYMMPTGFADAGYWGYDFIYATTTDLIFRADNGYAMGGNVGGYAVNIYYKIFRNNLGV